MLEKKIESLAIEFLEQGVDLAIGIPGSGPVLNFLSYYVKHGGTFWLCRHEASAPIIAGTIGKREHKPLISLCANGTARTNLLSGITHCWFEKLPVIALWDCYGYSVPKHQKLQRLPEHDFSPFYNMLLSGFCEHDESIGKQLVQASLKPDYGPVALNLRMSKNPLHEFKDRGISNSDKVVDFKVGRKSERPIIIFGSAVTRGGQAEEVIRAFSEMPIPKLTTIGAKGLFSEKDEYNFRVFTGVGGVNTPEKRILEQADLIIGINLRHSDVISVKPFGKDTILFDTELYDEADGFEGKQYVIHSFENIREKISEISDPKWTREECQSLMREAEEAILQEENQSGILLHFASKELFGKTTVVVDDGIFQKQSEYFWLTEHYAQYVATGVGRNMGSALPSAIGLALRYPQENIICLTGDGGLPMFLGELSMLMEQPHGNLLIIHFADFSLASMKTKRLDNIDPLVSVPTSYYEIMKGFGFKTEATDVVEVAIEKILNWDKASGDLFLEFKLNKEVYVDTFFMIR